MGNQILPICQPVNINQGEGRAEPGGSSAYIYTSVTHSAMVGGLL